MAVATTENNHYGLTDRDLKTITDALDAFPELTNPDFMEHIQRVGILFYKREETP